MITECANCSAMSIAAALEKDDEDFLICHKCGKHEVNTLWDSEVLERLEKPRTKRDVSADIREIASLLKRGILSLSDAQARANLALDTLKEE